MKSIIEENFELWGADLTLEEENSRKDQLFVIYKKIAILLSNGVSIGDILLNMNIHKVKIYGYGELGKLLIKNIKGKIDICAVYDISEKFISNVSEYIVESPKNISNDGTPIIITPGRFYRQISYDLINKGVDRKSLIALNTILTYGMERLKHGKKYNFPKYGEKQFLITGAQFHNNGAQAMLFVAISEIRKHFPNAIIWYLPVDDMEFYSFKLQQRYKLLFLTDGRDLRSQLYEILPGLTAIIDVSGYALSSNWNSNWYIEQLRMAYNYRLPIYLMPQSFGPFDYDNRINAELKKLLSNVTKIYTRENLGYKLLTEKYDLTNVYMSNDLVLQNKEINFNRIYMQEKNGQIIHLPTKENNIGIVPNVRSYEFGDKGEVLYMYKLLIDRLLKMGKNVYIIAHSDDKVPCDDIYAMFYKEKGMYLYTDYMDCDDYCKMVKNFQYLIASRFHAIVHAYKENVPCIIVGWAEKYMQLAELFEQDRYVFDVRWNINMQRFLQTIDDMNLYCAEEKIKLKKRLSKIQEGNCFDFLDDM